MKLDHQTAYGAGALLKGKSTFLLFCILWIALPVKILIPENHTYVSSMSKPIHVYCLCQNQWVNGQVKNLAEVELRDGTSFGPVIADADVLVNRICNDGCYKCEDCRKLPVKIRSRAFLPLSGVIEQRHRSHTAGGISKEIQSHIKHTRVLEAEIERFCP